jgi:hypothetical protein
MCLFAASLAGLTLSAYLNIYIVNNEISIILDNNGVSPATKYDIEFFDLCPLFLKLILIFFLSVIWWGCVFTVYNSLKLKE